MDNGGPKDRSCPIFACLIGTEHVLAESWCKKQRTAAITDPAHETFLVSVQNPVIDQRPPGCEAAVYLADIRSYESGDAAETSIKASCDLVDEALHFTVASVPQR